MNRCVFLADTYLSWMPSWSGLGFGLLLLTCALLWAILFLAWGPSRVHGRMGLWVLRCGTLAILGIILLGPTIIEQQTGAVKRSPMIYLVDGSESMDLGNHETRWQTGLRFLAEAQQAAGAEHSSDCQSFRFGHRLEPLTRTSGTLTTTGKVATEAAAAGHADGESAIAPPDASDSRLADALRQLLPQISGGTSPEVVLISDGRVRSTESVERLAELFGDAGVPLHAVPVGETSGSGDIAVVSLVVPSRVRKYTENELQVFLRSYGFTGQRTTVRLLSRNRLADGDAATLASVPLTLSGGAQSASLTFRVGEQAEDLEVVVDPVEGEITDRNNRVETRVEIDRTKVRVLYLQDARASASQPLAFLGIALGGGASQQSGGAGPLTVQDALQSDEDIECTVMVSAGGDLPRVSNAGSSTAAPISFPRTRAELFAYDCVVFSEVGPDVLDEEHREWLAQWVAGRGGGLVVTGGRASAIDAWQDSPLLPLLPVTLNDPQAAAAGPAEIDVVSADHPVWQLRLEQRSNEQILEQLPPLQLSERAYQPKPTAEVLAVTRSTANAVMTAHRTGRGRVLFSTAAIGDRALANLAEAWGPQPERVASKFWRNIVYWVTEGSSTGRRRLIAESDKRFYRPGEPLTIAASAFDEAARRTQKYRLWAMFEPASLDDMTLYSPLLWPDNVVRESGEVGPRIAWGEELPLTRRPDGDGYVMDLMLSSTSGVGDSELRVEMTAYEGDESASAWDHGTQVDSTSLAIQILSDPFEQQNPLPNHELLERLAAISGGRVLREPAALAELLKQRPRAYGPPKREASPAWSRWWLWVSLLGLLSTEWVWRRVTGLA